jgi:tetratricopeptide (TPR) repeat protein
MSHKLQDWNDELAYEVSERAYLLYTEGRYREALILFDGLRVLYPENTYYIDALSAISLAIHQPERAIRYASEVIEIKPNYAEAFMRRAEGYILLGMSREAERDLEQLEALNASHLALIVGMRIRAFNESVLLH